MDNAKRYEAPTPAELIERLDALEAEVARHRTILSEFTTDEEQQADMLNAELDGQFGEGASEAS